MDKWYQSSFWSGLWICMAYTYIAMFFTNPETINYASVTIASVLLLCSWIYLPGKLKSIGRSSKRMCLEAKQLVSRPSDVSTVTAYGVRRLVKNTRGEYEVLSLFRDYRWKFGDNRVEQTTISYQGNMVNGGVFHLLLDKEAAFNSACDLATQHGKDYAIIPVEVRWRDIRWLGIGANVNVDGMDGTLQIAATRCCWDGRGDIVSEYGYEEDNTQLIEPR